MKYIWHGRLGFSVVENAPLSGPSFLQLKQKLKSSITVYRNAILMSFQKKLTLCVWWPITFARVCLPRVVLNRAIHSIDARLLIASRNSPLTPTKFWGSKLVWRTHKLHLSFQRWFPGFALHISRSKTRWPLGKRAPAETIAGLHVTCGSHIGGQEQKPFSPLGTKLYFDVNSLKQLLQSTPYNSKSGARRK